MSLIYDYLKIHGESGSDKDSDVEIPPTLKRRDTNRFNTQALPLILGSCLIGALFIFLIIKIITPDQSVQVASESGQVPVAQTRQMPATSLSPTPETELALLQEKTVSDVAAISQDSEQESAGAEARIQVFPETGKPVMVDAVESADFSNSYAEQSGPVRKKIIPPLELASRARKITFPENGPLYSEPETPAETSATAAARSTQKSVSMPNIAARNQGRRFYQAGLQSQRSGDQRIAEIYYKKALEEMGRHMNSMINLSALYVQQERYAEAEEILTEILTLDPENSKALVNMGVVRLYDDNESQAEKYFQAALVANPIEENALVNLAYLAEKRRDFVSTERYYRHLLQISPYNLEVLLAYGHLLEEEERYPEAMALYKDILELGSVKKDQQLYYKITQRQRQLAAVVNNSQL